MRKWIMWAVILVVMGSLSACSRGSESSSQKEEQNVEEKQNEVDDKKASADSGERNDGTYIAEQQTLTVYYADENAEIQSKQVEVDEITPETVWKEIAAANPVLEKVSVISCDIREDEKVIDLNVSAELGDYLRSTGTTGETITITAIVNTYLDAFGCDQIKILDNGGVLASNHKEYSNYMKKR